MLHDRRQGVLWNAPIIALRTPIVTSDGQSLEIRSGADTHSPGASVSANVPG